MKEVHITSKSSMKSNDEVRERMVGYCGITCSECAVFLATQKDDIQEKRRIAKRRKVNVDDINCDGCLTRGPRLFRYCEFCRVRKCGQEKEIENCTYCTEYPCSRTKSDHHMKYDLHMHRRRKVEQLVLLSQLCHLGLFTLRQPKTRLDIGTLITSVDVDVGCEAVGEKNNGKNDLNVHGYLSECDIGKIEEKMIPEIVRFYDQMEIPVTFAIRGQLVEVENDVFDLLSRSSAEHDVGAHSYYHRTFTNLSSTEARSELELISEGLPKFGFTPRSFVFPKNKVDHLFLLEKFGYKCYRAEGGLVRDGMYIRKQGQLYDIHPSFHLGATFDPIFLDKIVDIAAKRRLPFHLWFHPRDLFEITGSAQKTIDRVILPLYKHAKLREREGTLKFETMYSIARKISH